MIVVAGVQVSVVQVVDMVAVRDGSVAAPGAVFVIVMAVFDAQSFGAFVPVIVVLVMSMTVVDVVHVIAMNDRHVAAIGSVHVGMYIVPVIVPVITRVRRIAHGSSLASTRSTVWNGRVTSAVDRLLDLSVVGGFSRVGFAVRSRQASWESLPAGALTGQRIVVTGPTSGIGRAAAGQLHDLGADLVLVGRNESRLRGVADQLGSRCEMVIADMSDLDAVARAGDRLATSTAPDAVIHNAGALLSRMTRTAQNFEATIATHVLAPHLMTRRLPCQRTIWVSSGGMYGASLHDVARSDPMDPVRYDGTRQYALAKRMQVTLVEQWATVRPDVLFATMHPGWADTPGVRSSLPGFARVTSPVLRTAEQGADTITWLCATPSPLRSGRFWCDRAERPIHRLPMTTRSDTPERREALWEWVERLTAAWS